MTQTDEKDVETFNFMQFFGVKKVHLDQAGWHFFGCAGELISAEKGSGPPAMRDEAGLGWNFGVAVGVRVER